MKNRIFLLLASFWFLKCEAQVPTTDIYVLDMKMHHGQYLFTNPVKISDWKGYNNQPYFTPDGKTVYYVSYRNKQSDIYRYDMASGRTGQFTNTPEDEYSPKLTTDGKYISVVRVMKDSSQQFWKFPLSGGSPERIYKGMKLDDSIAYYCWQGTRLVCTTVPEPMKVEVRDTFMKGDEETKKQQWEDESIIFGHSAGRTLCPMNDKAKRVLFVQKPTDKHDSIYQISTIDKDLNIERVVKTLPNSEDFVLGPEHTLYMGYKGRLYKYKIGKDKEWVQIADFANTPYQNFYRLAINARGDKIALVSYEGKKP